MIYIYIYRERESPLQHLPNTGFKRERVFSSQPNRKPVDNLAPNQDKVDLVLDFESAEDDCTETAGGQGMDEALSRSTIEVVRQVCGGDQGPEPERLLHVAQYLPLTLPRPTNELLSSFAAPRPYSASPWRPGNKI